MQDSNDDVRTAMLFCPPLPPLRLEVGTMVAIGRHPSCEFPLRVSDVSRRHCEVRGDEGRFTLRDLGSTNGTFLNGKQVQGDAPLKAGDRIELGSSTITFCEIDAAIDDALLVPGEAKTMVFERAPTADAFQGELSSIPSFAVLQVLEMGGKTGVLEVQSDEGPARIWFRDGRPVHAETEKNAGFDAAVTVVNTKQGRFQFEADTQRVDETIRAAVTELLLEAGRIEDEANRLDFA